LSILEITRKLEFDAGHRIPNHHGQCKHLHGHRYQLEITISGEMIKKSGASDEGMVLDFGQIKQIAKEQLVDLWDHAFLVARADTEVLNFLNKLPNHKTVILDEIPTVENLAEKAFAMLSPLIEKEFEGRIYLKKVRLYETPNCWADVSVSR